MKKITFLLFIISYAVQAQNQGVKVFITDEFIDSSTLEKKYEVTREPVKNFILPNRSDRETFLHDVAIPQEWDELDKDIFYMDLLNKSTNDLVKKYPMFKESELKTLKAKRK